MPWGTLTCALCYRRGCGRGADDPTLGGGGGASVGLSRLWVLKGWSGSLPFRIPGTCIRPHLE